jgi:hypothetical protein
MPPDPKTSGLLIHVRAAEDIGVEELTELVRRLSEELLELDVKATSPVHAAGIPTRGKIGHPIVIGDLLVVSEDLDESLLTLTEAIQDWATRHEQHIEDLQIRRR